MPQQEELTVQVSFRLPSDLVRRMRAISQTDDWPPPPTQTDMVQRGVEMVLRKLEKEKAKAKARAKG